MNKDSTCENVFKAGFIAIVGAPNAGKSTLLNTILGHKISITSKKPQTTRDRILGVVETTGAQIIFVDTPGIHRANSLLNKKIVNQALCAVDDVDAILLMIDVTSRDQESEALIIEQLQLRNKSVVLALNKIDLVKSHEILPLIARYSSLYEFKAVVPVSAMTGDQTEKLVAEVEQCLPAGERLFPKDTLTDVSERFIAGEMVREKVFRLTGMEIPYSIAVTVDSFKELATMTEIHATIHVERDSQKGIIIGKGGRMLKQIGAKARMDIQRMTGTKVMLKLFVRVTKNWSRNERIMKEFGY